MRQLYPPEKGMHLLPSGPATATGYETEVNVPVISRTEDSLGVVFSRDGSGLAIRCPRTAAPAFDNTIDQEHGTTHGAAGEGQVLSR